MRLSTAFRHRIVPVVAVLGVGVIASACKQSATRGPHAPAVTEDSSVCALDEVRESFCSKRRAGACAATGAGAETIEAIDVLPSTYLMSGLPALAKFSFDAKRSAHEDETCCFTRCTLLEVCAVRHPAANEPSSNTRVDGTYDLQQYCIGKPEAGTSVPSEANEACPAAILFSGRGFRTDWWNAASPYTGESSGKCCYRVERVSIPGRPRAAGPGKGARASGAEPGPGAT